MSGLDKDAKVSVGIEGAEDVGRAAERALKPWAEGASKVDRGIAALGQSVDQVIGGLVKDIASAATSMGKLSFAELAAKFQQSEMSAARLAVVTGKTVAQVKQQFRSLSDQTLLPDAEIAKYSLALQGATHSTEGIGAAIAGAQRDSIALNTPLEDLIGLAAQMKVSFGVALTDVPAMFDKIRAAAESLGQTGGPAALAKQVRAAMPSLSHTTLDPKKAPALLSALGKGLPEDLQAEVQQRIIGRVQANPIGLMHQMGMKREDFFDKQGRQRFDAKFLTKLRTQSKKRWGKDALEVLSQPGNFGPIAAAALMNFNEADVDRASTATPSARPTLDPSVVERARKKNRADYNKTETVGKHVTDAQDWFTETFGDNPLVAAAADSAGTVAAGGVAGLIAKYGVGALGKVGVGAVGGLASTIAVAGAGLYGGYEFGEDLDDTTGASDWLSGTGGSNRIRSADDAAFAQDEARRARARARAQTAMFPEGGGEGGSSGGGGGLMDALVRAVVDGIAKAALEVTVKVENASDNVVSASAQQRGKGAGN